jgi:hypothetical protein
MEYQRALESGQVNQSEKIQSATHLGWQTETCGLVEKMAQATVLENQLVRFLWEN